VSSIWDAHTVHGLGVATAGANL